MAPSPNFSKKIDVSKQIQNTIVELGHALTHSTTTDASTMMEMGLGILDQEEWEILCKREMDLLKEADAAIFEVSDKASFGTGYLAALALMSNKPTLFLLAEGNLQGSFTSGLKHSSLTRKTYNDRTIRKIIKDFMNQQG